MMDVSEVFERPVMTNLVMAAFLYAVTPTSG
jgi:hypothetical protein